MDFDSFFVQYALLHCMKISLKVKSSQHFGQAFYFFMLFIPTLHAFANISLLDYAEHEIGFNFGITFA